ncbi:OLC1v1030725C1 [Oldenlandia corymbosa var. corymbosa]|uniref:OLC1v1030725C1 n=1 Tax=Oldenlandia corymbosa var. corymbosa TaxID=529605 RepID=A0AAV1CHJ7_OLDCO|nr:OLC1v1030725C1 [Oldenlandia corymbosa var. corymbosa]
MNVRALKGVWREVLEGARWSLGDGKMVRFWLDRWLGNQDTLISLARHPIPEEHLQLPVANFVSNGAWDWQAFQHLLPATCLMRLSAIAVPTGGVGDDKMYWGYSDDGGFTTKSAYSKLTPTMDSNDRHSWNAGLSLACEKGGRKVIPEVDNSSIISMLLSMKEIVGLNTGIVYRIHDLLKREWVVEFKHVFWEANFMAGYMASLAAQEPGGL